MHISCMAMISRVCTSILFIGVPCTVRWPLVFNRALEDKTSNSVSHLALKLLQNSVINYINDKLDNKISEHYI